MIDSVLYFLKCVGGIDFFCGSFRNIEIIWNGEIIEVIDLYDFVINGLLFVFFF